MSIHDDQTGEGADLAFPTMSTCCACICRLHNRLVGVHKTQGWDGGRVRLFAHAVGLINADPVLELFLLGWRVGDANFHDVPQIRGALGCNAVTTYTYNFANTTTLSGLGNQVMAHRSPRSFGNMTVGLCTFAFSQPNASPTIGLKRSAKIVVTPQGLAARHAHTAAHGGRAVARYFGMVEDIETPSDHLHHIRKHLDFRRVR